MTALANIAVCGRFHFGGYVRHVHQRGHLHRFYYSHKLGKGPSDLGVPRERLVNAWPKEYLTRAHLRVLGDATAVELFARYQEIWQRGILRRWSPAPILHAMIHGGERRLLQRAHADGSVVLGEPVNTRPRELVELIDDERRQLGLEPIGRLQTWQQQIEEETLACDRLLVASRFIGDSFVRAGFAADRIEVVPYGVDLTRFTPPERREDGIFRVLCVGQVSPRKGQVHLLEAWKQAALPNAELVLVGAVHAGMESVLSRYAGTFRHVERVPNSELREWYGRASAFVLPSIEDGFGVVVGEALACGLPVVVTENTGAAETVDDGVDGFVVPIRSPVAIAERLTTLHADRDLRDRMGRAAGTKAGTLSWERYAERICALYRAQMPRQFPGR